MGSKLATPPNFNLSLGLARLGTSYSRTPFDMAEAAIVCGRCRMPFASERGLARHRATCRSSSDDDDGGSSSGEEGDNEDDDVGDGVDEEGVPEEGSDEAEASDSSKVRRTCPVDPD